jgi:hypothetical protein
MLKFNKLGYLEPYNLIPSDIKELEKTFVVEYSSVERSSLFNQYIRYSEDLKQLCGNLDLVQWINGSFISINKPRPSDIDMVTFVDTKTFRKLGDELRPFAYPKSKENYPGVDAYIVECFTDDDNVLYNSDKAYWYHQFNSSRRNRRGKKLPKGFLEIIY